MHHNNVRIHTLLAYHTLNQPIKVHHNPINKYHAHTSTPHQLVGSRVGHMSPAKGEAAVEEWGIDDKDKGQGMLQGTGWIIAE
ncbi:hypothetical protein EON65_44770 [archaeon]|nr:MAG: hypothetical protein EON65_44770 [archaeon]